MKCSVDEFEVNLPACWYALKGQGRHWSRLGWLKPCEYLSLQGHRYFHRPHDPISSFHAQLGNLVWCLISWQTWIFTIVWSSFIMFGWQALLTCQAQQFLAWWLADPPWLLLMLEPCSNLEIAGMYPTLHYATPDSDVPHPSQPTFAPGPWSSLSPTPPLVGGGGSSQFQDFHSMGSSLEPKQGTVTRVAFF